MTERGLPPARRLWERVERERNARGWTTLELEKRSGVDRSTVSRWRTARRAPRPETVNAIADAFGLPRHELLGDAGLLSSPMKRGLHDAITAPMPAVDHAVTGEDDTDDLLAKLPPARRALLEQVRAAERERLERIAVAAVREAEEANRKFAALVRDAVRGEDDDTQD
ncbi:XRE family transcriptional regulator [Nonomuraea mesophila]|uniref:XRE family transcriptional regulator n=1 Tax=Nonomuraea mesophila TaxID=2530382 RepID=A0A4V2Z8D1_9ACTN|nr:helix-turn-helix transcriptional regulator [Nonomuraea mesophila]TDE39946.1 XRE family transcriptional regulator [Nonomuraea mesophila]